MKKENENAVNGSLKFTTSFSNTLQKSGKSCAVQLYHFLFQFCVLLRKIEGKQKFKKGIEIFLRQKCKDNNHAYGFNIIQHGIKLCFLLMVYIILLTNCSDKKKMF